MDVPFRLLSDEIESPPDDTITDPLKETVSPFALFAVTVRVPVPACSRTRLPPRNRPSETLSDLSNRRVGGVPGPNLHPTPRPPLASDPVVPPSPTCRMECAPI